MKIAISALNNKTSKIKRQELVKLIQDKGHSVAYLGVENKRSDNLHQDYKKLNVEFIPIPLNKSNINPFKELSSVLKIKNILRSNEIDALIIYGIRTFPAIVLAAKLANVKKVLCVVNGSGKLFQLSGIKGLFIKTISYPMLWFTFLITNKILFQNPDDKKMIKKKGLIWRENYADINGSGVNLDYFKITELEKQPVFVMIARLIGSKGVNEYIQAARKVKKKIPESKFYLIGSMDKNDSSIDKDLLNKAIENNVITLQGEVEDVRPYLKKARVFVLPSYYPEGVPRSILEAMAMGRPILTTDSPGCRRTVENGVNGFLVAPKNVNELAEKMLWIIENESKVEIMGQNSRKICEKAFDINKVNQKMLSEMDLFK